MNQDSDSYFGKLQRLAVEQDKAKLATLAVEFSSTLEKFPKVRAEIDAFLSSEHLLDYTGLVVRVESALEQASVFLSELDFLPADLLKEAEIPAFVQTACNSLTLRTIDGVSDRFQLLCRQVRDELSRKKQERSEKEAAQRKAAADRKERERTLRLAAIPELVSIPAGSFTMGDAVGREITQAFLEEVDMCWELYPDVDSACPGDDQIPAHVVRLSPFMLTKYPVTFNEFDAYCELSGFAKPDDDGWGRGRLPVINVSRDDIHSYIDWIKEVTRKVWRLPTEAQWEYAARGGNDDNVYPWGNSPDHRYANFGMEIGRTTPVGQYPSNGFGLYDMHGNVFELIRDFHSWNYYSESSSVDPQGPERSSSSGAFLMRGGGWHSEELCSSSDRWKFYGGDYCGNENGFRLMRQS